MVDWDIVRGDQNRVSRWLVIQADIHLSFALGSHFGSLLCGHDV